MLRAAVLLSLLRRILRFSTTGRPGALGACYVASWQLPRLDFHQLADDSFQGTPALCQAAPPGNVSRWGRSGVPTGSRKGSPGFNCRKHADSPWTWGSESSGLQLA